MASPRIASPMRGVSYQLSRLSLRHDAVPKSLPASFARTITTSTSSQAAVSSITTSVDGYVPVKPFHEQSVLATIHKFPSLEPLCLHSYPANYLNLPTRKDILHRAVIYEGDMTRSGTAHTKTRYEVRGSSRKIRPQKGSGRARLGDKKSPMLRGGGVSHGPRHRDFSTELPKKVYDLAWRTALSYRWRKGELIIVDNAIEIESPSQTLLKHIFSVHDQERGRGRSLLVTSENRPLLEQALEKMDRPRQALTWDDVDVKDLLELSRIIIERQALWKIFNSHRSDLQSLSPPPYLRREPKAPEAYESISGWTQFRALMTSSPADRPTLRAEAYESVAYERWQRAEALPETDPEKLPLTISAYEILATAKHLRRNLLPTDSYLKYVYKQKEDLAAKTTENTPEADEATLEAIEAKIAWLDMHRETYELQAQAAEHLRDALRWKNEEHMAMEKENHAAKLRTSLAAVEKQLLEARIDGAKVQAQVLINKEDYASAETCQLEVEALQAQLDELRAEPDMEVEAGEESEAQVQEAEKDVKSNKL